MDKKIRSILILAGILALLCVGYAAVGLLFPEEAEPADTEGDTTGGTSALFAVTEDGLTALSFTFDGDGDGEAELWSYTRSADGETWHWGEDLAVPLSSASFYGYSSTLAGMTSIKTLTNVTPAQLAEYGLDKPVKTVTFTDRVGGEQGFCVGIYNTYNGTYCVSRSDDPTTVYMVDGSFFAEFEYPVEALVHHDDLPAFKPEALVSLTLTQGERTVTLTRSVSETGAAVWRRSVDGAAPVTVAADLAESLELLAGDMDYLTCYSVREADLAEYGLTENTTRMAVVYTKTAEGEEQEITFALTLGDTDKYGYYYARPEGTTLTMLLGGSVFHKVMTYDDDRLAEGDSPAETDTTAP